MSAHIIDGKVCANELLNHLQHQVKILKNKHKLIPGIAIIIVGEDPASEIYIKYKMKIADQIGVSNFLFRIPIDIMEKHLIAKIETLNNDPKIHGILVQLPLPKSINTYAIINAINPAKDVDGFHPENVGKLVTGQKALVPATAIGCVKLIKTVKKDLTGLKAIVIGRSNIVGKPVAQLLVNENCTVTLIHSKSKNIYDEMQNADIIIVAIGSAEFLKSDKVKSDAIVIDVGINRCEDSKALKGDVDFEYMKDKVGYITPVPGGVGPMTIACLLENTVIAACNSKGLDIDSI